MGEEVPDVVADLLALCKPSDALSPTQVRSAQKLSLATLDFINIQANEFLRKHQDDTIVVWWSADTTPLKIRQSWAMRWDDLTVRRAWGKL